MTRDRLTLACYAVLLLLAVLALAQDVALIR